MTTSTNPSRPARFGPWSREIRSFLELLALTGLAVAQPTFDILAGDGASLFISRRSTPTTVVVATFAIVLVPPLALWAIEVVVGLVVPTARRWAHAGLAGMVGGVIAMEALKQATASSPPVLMLFGVFVAVVGCAVVARFMVVRMWLRFLSVAPLLLAGLFLFASPVHTVVFENGNGNIARVPVGKPARVVFIAMDELPTRSLLDGTGQIDATLFPNFAALAAGSTWYRNETTAATTTDAAIPALLTGDFPDGSTPAVAASYPENLFTLLGGSYDMNVHEQVTKLCPAKLCPALAPAGGAVDLLSDASELWTTFASPDGKERSTENAGDVTGLGDLAEPNANRRGLEFVESLGSDTSSVLDFVHLPLPHTPWHYLPSGQDDGDLDLRGFTFYEWGTEWTAASARLRHLLQVQYSDRLLGQIVQRLKDQGAYSDALLVVTADHGVAFNVGEHHRYFTPANANAIAYTPLFIKAPHQQTGERDDRTVRSIDVVPTIAAMLDIELPWKTDGRSVVGPATPDVPVEISLTGFDTVETEPGTDRARLDGPAGFAETLAAAASRSEGDPELRLYRIGPYGALIGEPAAPLIGPESDDRTAVVNGLDAFDDVDTKAQRIPWASINGHVSGLTTGQRLAVVVNGTVVAVSETFTPFGVSPDDPIFWANIPPKLVRDGRNTLEIARIVGSPENPELIPLRVSG